MPRTGRKVQPHGGPPSGAASARDLASPAGDRGMPGELGAIVEAAGERHGGIDAIRLLQAVLCDMGLRVEKHGRLGPETLDALAAAWGTGPRHVIDAYCLALRGHAYRLAERAPAARAKVATRDGGKGEWIAMAERGLSPAYRLNADEHARRIASWA